MASLVESRVVISEPWAVHQVGGREPSDPPPAHQVVRSKRGGWRKEGVKWRKIRYVIDNKGLGPKGSSLMGDG